MLRCFRQHLHRYCDSGQLVRMFDWQLLDEPYQSREWTTSASGYPVRFFTQARSLTVRRAPGRPDTLECASIQPAG